MPSLFASLMDDQSQRYSIYHVWKMCSTIRQKGPIGRKELAQVLDLGEGTVRTIMEKLKEDGLMECTRRGASLTDQGLRRLDSLGIEVKPIDATDITLDRCNCAVFVAGVASRIKDGCEQRDESVKAGATGATTLIRKGGRIVFPGDDSYPNLEVSNELNRLFRFRDGDAVIIGSAPSYDPAERGAVAAALRIHAPFVARWRDNSPFSEFMDPGDMRCFAMAVHELVGYMPFAIRTKSQLGILCEDGVIVSDKYTGPYLEEALKTGKTVRVVPSVGLYKGVPVICVPMLKNGRAVVVMGLVDSTKLSIHDIMGRVRRDSSPIEIDQDLLAR